MIHRLEAAAAAAGEKDPSNKEKGRQDGDRGPLMKNDSDSDDDDKD
ncbi:MAG: hypothetical protein GY822_28580, partial [Deltaproteobacteria bacterium]|nr:hypothetical protein [Deltaproteobacteria bacterium]